MTATTLKRFDIRFDWVDKQEAQRILGIKEAQLRNDTAILLELETPGFDYIPYSDKGYTKQSMSVLVEFRKIAESKGRKRAIAEINNHMEVYWNESKGQTSRR